MRKQFKKALSMVLSAAMVLTLGSGYELKSAKAADTTKEWVDVAYTAATVTFEYASGSGSSETTLFSSVQKNHATFTENKTYTFNVYDEMTAAYTGNMGWFENKTESYTIKNAKATLTTADGDVVLVLGDFTAEDKEGIFKVDFPNMWGADKEDIVWTATDSETRVVKVDNALGLQMFKEPAAPEVTEAPAATGSATPASGSATPGETPAPVASGSGFGPYDAMFNMNGGDVQYWGPDNSSNTEGVVAYDTVVESEEDGGQYKVALDFRLTEVGYADLVFLALMVNGAEADHPDYAIRLDAMKINGDSVDAGTLAKAYTCSDNKVDTRVNIYNSWCGSEEPVGREDARTYGAALEDTTPMVLEDYVDEEINTIELAFTYGSSDYINATEEQDLEDSIIKEPDLPTQAPTQAPGTSATKAPGTSATQAPAPGTNATQAPAPGTNATQAPATGVANGTTAKVGTANYKVTSASTVEYSGSTQKNPTSVTIPATVKIKGKSFKVTSIKAKAFANKKKLKSVTIGKNIKTIGKQAFFKCAKLKKITFKGTAVTKIGAKAFAKGAKKPTVTTPKKMKKKALNSLKKKLKKAGLNKKAKYKKK